jgi:two-component system, NarL family, nitrate/nitrite response regulator NarL
MSLSQNQRVPSLSQEGNPWNGLKRRKSDPAPKILNTYESPVRILIVDRDEMSSDLLAVRLAREGNLQASGIRSADLLDSMATGDVQLVVIGADLNQVPKAGFDLAQAVHRQHPTAPIVMILNQSTQDAVINAFRSGARGVFSRQQQISDFFDCVEHVRKGFIWAGSQETAFLVDALASGPCDSTFWAIDSSPLTIRELQVVKCAARGKTNKKIACELGLSEHTVKNYLFRAFEKLGVSNRVELLFYLTQKGHNPGTSPGPIL